MLHTDWQLVTGCPSCITHRLAVSYRVAELCYTETGSWLPGDLDVLYIRLIASSLEGDLAVLHILAVCYKVT